MFALESHHRVLIEYTQYTIFNKNENRFKLSHICSYGILSLGTQERVRNSRGNRAIGVRATEVLMYLNTKHNQGAIVGTECLFQN